MVHAGLPPSAQGEPFLPGPTLAAPFHVHGDPDEAPHAYTREGNPTWSLYEAALGALEGGHAVLFASGMAACAAVLLPQLGPGHVLVAPADGYPAVRTIATRYLARRGVEVRLVAATDEAYREALPGATLVFAETPTNPRLDVLDVPALADASRAAGARLAVDTTLATPLLQRPLELGADFAVASASKALTGHSDLIMGYVACRTPDDARDLEAWRTATGAIAGPFETWLAHRSLKTLDVRLERACANALALASLLTARSDAEEVRYPGLPSHPHHALATRLWGGRYGTVLTFELAGEREAQAFLDAATLVTEATSFGGVHTSAERRARWPGNDVPPGFIRMSAGIEDRDDLLLDVAAALDAVN